MAITLTGKMNSKKHNRNKENKNSPPNATVLKDFPCAGITFLTDEDMTIIDKNQEFLLLLGYSHKTKIRKKIKSLKDILKPEHYERNRQDLISQLDKSQKVEMELQILNSQNSIRWVFLKGKYNKEKNISRVTGILIDISEKKLHQINLKQRAELDPLTNLYNRKTAQMLIEEYLSHAEPHDSGALVIIDIDNFKKINDTCGHPFGDRIIINIAYTLKKTFRSSDIIGRIGGDEMIVFMKNVKSKKIIETKLKKIIQTIIDNAPKSGKTQRVTCSLGCAIFPYSGTDFQTLYNNADTALYMAKSQGKGIAIIYDDITDESDFGQIHYNLNARRKNKELLTEFFLQRHAFNHLYEAKDIFKTLNSILAIIGETFDVSRVYIFENSQDGKYTVNTFEWCANGISPMIHTLQHLKRTTLKNYYSSMKKTQGLFYCSDVLDLTPELQEILKPQGIKSMLHYELTDEGENIGFVGFDECRDIKCWNLKQIEVITELARIVGIFLRLYRLKHGYALEELQKTVILNNPNNHKL